MSGGALLKLPVALAVCAQIAFAPAALAGPHDELVAKHAAANGVPEHLVHRVIRIESRGNASAVHAGNYGLMQIRLGTARGIGYSGSASGLLDPDTNLTYAVRYLAGAYRAAGCNADRAVSYYQRGYYGAQQSACGTPAAALLQAAQADAVATRKPDGAKRKPDVAPPPSADVIRPKMVRTETIATPSSGLAPVRPTGSFEPVRAETPPVQPVAASPAVIKPEPTSAKSDSLRPAPVEPAAKFELASVPLPPVRPELDPASKPDVKATHRSGRAHDSMRVPAATGKTGRAAKTDEPAVISFIKNLVTPDPKSVKRRSEAEAQAQEFPHVQPPQ